MTAQHLFLSCRSVCLCGVVTATATETGGWLTPREAYVKTRNIVEQIRASAETAFITSHKVTENISVLEGSGGNIGVLTGGDGKLLIDAGITASKSRLLEALGELTKDPVKTLINTHWHFDHSDGNIWLHEQGAIIIAHENTRKHLLSMQRVEDWDFNFPPLPSAGIPTEIFSDAKTIEFNNMTLSLNHYAPAHTDSDISVRFTEADVIHVGDTYWNGIYPFIDYSTGGSIGGMIQACEDNLANTTEDTIIIAGHGAPLSNRSELKAFRDMLLGAYENVSRLKRQGLSLKETVAANPTARYDEKWGQYVITPMLFTKLIYEGC